MKWLLLAAPLAIILDHLSGIPAPLVFFSAALAIVPIAGFIVESTENVAGYTGPAIGGLLNATFGNLPELIIAVVALRAGLVEMVRASIVGALLCNLLVGLGLAFFLGGLRQHQQEYNAAGARTYASMMLLAAMSMSIPSAFHRFFGATEGYVYEAALDKSVAVVLLATYGLYLLYQLYTHKEAFAAASEATGGHESGPHWSLPRALGTLVAASLAAAWMSEILVGAAETTGETLGMSPTFIGLILLAGVGSAAEIGSAVAMGRRNKMDLSVGIALGSCIQIALFVAPVLVLLGGLMAPKPFALSFSQAEMGVLFLTVFLGGAVASDGRSNWFKGVQLLAAYAILAAVCYLVPAVAAH